MTQPTKPMEEFFNLSNTDDLEDSLDQEIALTSPKTRNELIAEAKMISESLSTADKIDYALPAVVGLEAHDHELDDIATKALSTFNDLLSLGSNVPDMHAGKIFEVAGQMLKTAMEAKNAKADKKLKMIELQLKKARTEQIDFEQGNGIRRRDESGLSFDRNELLKMIVEVQPTPTTNNQGNGTINITTDTTLQNLNSDVINTDANKIDHTNKE